MQHVDTEEILRLLARREVRRRTLELLHRHAAIAFHVALGHFGGLLWEFARHEVIGVTAEFVDVLRRDDLRNDEKSVAAEADVLVHRHRKTRDLLRFLLGGHVTSLYMMSDSPRGADLLCKGD